MANGVEDPTNQYWEVEQPPNVLQRGPIIMQVTSEPEAVHQFDTRGRLKCLFNSPQIDIRLQGRTHLAL